MREPVGDRAINSFFYIGLVDAQEQFENWFRVGVKRVAFFSMSALLWDLAACSGPAGDQHVSDFYLAVENWADPYIHNTEVSDAGDPQA